MTELKYPWMRQEMREYTEYLADERYAMELLTAESPPPADDKFQYAIDFYFDDAAFADENPQRWLNVILRDPSEIEAVAEVVAALDRALGEIREAVYDIDFVKAPSWPQVVVAAKAMLATMDRLDAGSKEHQPDRE